MEDPAKLVKYVLVVYRCGFRITGVWLYSREWLIALQWQHNSSNSFFDNGVPIDKSVFHAYLSLNHRF